MLAATSSRSGGEVETIADLQFNEDETVALRLMQIALFAQDAAATPVLTRLPKDAALRSFLDSTATFATARGEDELISGLTDIDLDQVAGVAVKRLGSLEAVRTEALHLLALELVASTALPPKAKWAINRNMNASALIARLHGALYDASIVASMNKHALKALIVASRSPELRLAVAAGAVVVGVLTAPTGPLAPVIGTAIGNAMGLSGAAATSAGLAWLGGGSIAAGGFGMAGGTFVIAAAAKGANLGGQYLITELSSSEPDVIIGELAKLCVTAELYPSVVHEIVENVRRLTKELPSGTQAHRAAVAALRRVEDGPDAVMRATRTLMRLVPIPGADNIADRVRNWWDEPDTSR